MVCVRKLPITCYRLVLALEYSQRHVGRVRCANTYGGTNSAVAEFSGVHVSLDRSRSGTIWYSERLCLDGCVCWAMLLLLQGYR
jgi:hypothetical protein